MEKTSQGSIAMAATPETSSGSSVSRAASRGAATFAMPSPDWS